MIHYTACREKTQLYYQTLSQAVQLSSWNSTNGLSTDEKASGNITAIHGSPPVHLMMRLPAP